MTELPSPCNVFGTLFANAGLEQVAELLRSRLGLTKTEVYVWKSEGDLHGKLYIQTASYEFEVDKLAQKNTWNLNGSVAGDRTEILRILKYLSDPLHWAGYQTKFEVYDEEFNCIAEYPEIDRDL